MVASGAFISYTQAGRPRPPEDFCLLATKPLPTKTSSVSRAEFGCNSALAAMVEMLASWPKLQSVLNIACCAGEREATACRASIKATLVFYFREFRVSG